MAEESDWKKKLEEARANLIKRAEALKKAFVQMPGGQPAGDPAAGGAPADPAAGGMPMDPAMAGGDPAAMAGGLAAFLVYNLHPAKVFMGDTGSLFLGGAVAALAFAQDMPLVLIPVGIIYIAETMSDIIQVLYFKATHGKRFFKMAPLHHHMELSGWSENKLVVVFSGITLVCCALAYWGVCGR